MKIAIVYWTYNKDYDYLILTLSAIPRLKKKYPNVIIDAYIFDDGHNSCKRKFPAFVNYKKTTFNRHGNLNGLECIINIINEYKKLSENYDWVFKCDSDTYINNLDVLLSTDPNIYGLVGTNSQYNVPYGCSVAYSKNAIDFLYNSNLFYISYKILKSVPKGNRICDDLVFNLTILKNFKIVNIPILFSKVAPKKYKLIPGTYPGVLKLYNSELYTFQTFNLNLNTYLNHWCITFKKESSPRKPKLNAFLRKFGITKLKIFLNKLK